MWGNKKKFVVKAGVLLLLFCILITPSMCTASTAKTMQTTDDVTIIIRGGLVIRGISIYVKNNGNSVISVNYNVTQERVFSDAWSRMGGSYDLDPGESRESLPGASRFSKVTVTVQAGDTIVTRTGLTLITFTLFFT